MLQNEVEEVVEARSLKAWVLLKQDMKILVENSSKQVGQYRPLQLSRQEMTSLDQCIKWAKSTGFDNADDLMSRLALTQWPSA